MNKILAAIVEEEIPLFHYWDAAFKKCQIMMDHYWQQHPALQIPLSNGIVSPSQFN